MYQVAITMDYRYLPLSDKEGILDTACLYVVLIITLPGITLSPSAYRPFPTVANAVARLGAGCRWRGGKSAGTMPTLNALREDRRE